MEQPQKSKNCGIELLRIVSMFMVVVLHTLGQGGVLASVQPGTWQYTAAWFAEAACFCAVNCFGLVSGYVGVNSAFRPSKAVKLWLQVAFYTLLITAFFSFKAPEFLMSESWLNAALPITRGQYWYISAYMGVLLLTPLLNAAVQNLEKRTLTAVCVAGVVAFCILPRINQTDPYNMNAGYSMLWLALLYVAGGYIRKFGVFANVKKTVSLFVFLVSVAVTTAMKLLLEGTNIKLLGVPMPDTILFNYTSPFMVSAAIALLALFARVNVKNKPVKRAILLLAPASLGVYLIHVHPLVWQKYLFNFTMRFALGGGAAMALKTAAAAVLIYLACSAADLVRAALFKLAGVNRLCAALDRAAERRKQKIK